MVIGRNIELFKLFLQVNPGAKIALFYSYETVRKNHETFW